LGFMEMTRGQGEGRQGEGQQGERRQGEGRQGDRLYLGS
jgi:hypothetical protein